MLFYVTQVANPPSPSPAPPNYLLVQTLFMKIKRLVCNLITNTLNA